MIDKSKATNYKRAFNEQNYDRIEITVKKGTKQVLQEAAKDKGESINGYIKNAVQARYEADTGKEIDLQYQAAEFSASFFEKLLTYVILRVTIQVRGEKMTYSELKRQ